MGKKYAFYFVENFLKLRSNLFLLVKNEQDVTKYSPVGKLNRSI